MNENVNINEKAIEKKKIKLYFFIALAISAVAVALRSVSLLCFYDREAAYYTRGAVLPIISNVFYIAAVVFFFLSAYFLIKPKQSIAHMTKQHSVMAFLPGVAVSSHALSLLLIGIIFRAEGEPINRWSILAFVFALVSAVFFFTVAFSQKYSAVTVVSGIGFMLWCVISWFRSYMDFEIPMNSPDKLFFQFGVVGAILLVVAELRVMFDISKPKFYYFSLFTAILTLSVSVIPSVIGDIAGVFRVYKVGAENYVFFALLIYAIARVIMLIKKDSTETVQE